MALHLDVKIVPDHDETKLPVESYSIEQNESLYLDVIVMLPLSFFSILVEESPSTNSPSKSELNQFIFCSLMEM